MKIKFGALTLAAGILLALTGCEERDTDGMEIQLYQEEEEDTYPTVTVDYGNVVKNVSIPCTYLSTEQQDLSFPVDDRLIERVEVKEGDLVTKGQLLAALDVGDLEDKIEEQEYQVNSLALKLEQTRELKEFDLASAETLFTYTHMTEQDKKELAEKKEQIGKQYQTTLEDLEDSLSIAQKRLSQYRKELEEGQLFAGINGQITYISSPMTSMLKDTYSKKDQVILTISDRDACYFIADNVDYADHFDEGTSVKVSYKVSGVIYECGAFPVRMDDWETQMFFKPDSDEFLEIGLSGSITIQLEERENVLCIPRDAVHKSDKGSFVYLFRDGLLEMRYVTVGLEGESMAEITEGLAQGETVALKK